eukprot:scaffold81285_cov63-Phaeocystis_antarctica.AAC.3
MRPRAAISCRNHPLCYTLPPFRVSFESSPEHRAATPHAMWPATQGFPHDGRRPTARRAAARPRDCAMLL